MKKYLICLILAISTHNASAVSIEPPTPIDPVNPTQNNCDKEIYYKNCFDDEVYYSNCTQSACNNCENGIGISTPGTGTPGIISTETRKYTTHCPTSGDKTATCTCETTTTYSCDSGYYGTATSATTGCTKCPSNATCAGGNGSTFDCNKNYYKNGTTCTACPSSGLTESKGATNVTQCYITTFSDSTGSGIYTSKCYYTK